jgi:hypothetical protein
MAFFCSEAALELRRVFCSATGFALLNLSTGDAQLPATPDFPLVL